MKTPTTRSRNVRVFISSTFLDMYAEREELVKHVFPQLRTLCEQRRVTLSEVDLRWGIPPEAVDAGKVLPICLAEVENCRPFFICLLGERYGTRVDQIPDELFQNEPWLKNHPDKSITELEVLHGALNKAPDLVHAFFYLRKSLPVSAVPDLVTNARFPSEDAESQRKLEALKRRILNSGLPVREYTTPSEAGQMLLNDLTGLFERMFPEKSLSGLIEQEAAAHEAFVESRSQVYVSLRRYFDELDSYVESQRPPLVVVGRTGLGKSSLVANWKRRRLGYPTQIEPLPFIPNRVRILRFIQAFVAKERSPDALLLAHFVGASSASADRSAMLRRLIEVMREHFKLPLEIPDAPQALPTTFASYLQAIADRGRVVLILDGIDEFSTDEQTSKLAWLPEEIPTNVRMILTATQGWAVDELRRRRWPILEIKPLLSAEREVFVKQYLAQYRKTLDRKLTKRISSVDPASNPLYLRTVLEELRLFGRRTEELPALAEQLLAARSTDELFGQVFSRLENDYLSRTPYRPDLVRSTMSLLWAARQGLSESELGDLLGTADGPLPSSLWSPLYLGIKGSLLNRSGLLSFFHGDFRRAVEKRYLQEEGEKEAAHRELADYFKRNVSTHRRIVELPWHLAAIGAWTDLTSLLATPEFLSEAWPTYQFDLQSYWAKIEAHSQLLMLNAYAPIINTPEQHKDCIQAVCILLSNAGYVDEALILSVHLERTAREAENLQALEVSLSIRGQLLKRRGNLETALSLFREQEQICRRLGNGAALAASLGNQAVILRDTGKLDAALSIHKQEEAICRRLQDLAGLSASLGNQGVILQEKNNNVAALAFLGEQERICRQLGDLAGLQRSLGNQGLILWQRGETDTALKLLDEDEELCRQLGDLAALQACLGNKATVFSSLGDYDQALELHKQKEKICRDIGDMMGLARGLWLQSSLLAEKLRQLDLALPLAEEAQSIALQNNLGPLAQEIEKYVIQLNQQGARAS